jgi:hypothetical protein
VDISGIFGGEGTYPWAMACHDGRFRVLVSAEASWSGDPETDPELPVMYLLEVDPQTASLVGMPKYLNGVGRGGMERLTVYAEFRFHQDGERLFLAGSETPHHPYPLVFSIAEFDLAWDGIWDDDWYSWARWLSADTLDYVQLVSRWAAPVGDRIVYSWVDADNEYVTGCVAIGPQLEGGFEYGEYERIVSIEDLMQAGPMPRSGVLEMAVGTRTIAAACDEWMILFDHDLERVGRPVNFSSREHGWRHYRVLFGGGYYAVIHTGTVPDPSIPYGVSADFAVSLVNEDAEFVDRKVLLCPTDGLPNTLLDWESFLMDAYWAGNGFWMVFATQPVSPGPWELRVFFLPVP